MHSQEGLHNGRKQRDFFYSSGETHLLQQGSYPSTWSRILLRICYKCAKNKTWFGRAHAIRDLRSPKLRAITYKTVVELLSFINTGEPRIDPLHFPTWQDKGIRSRALPGDYMAGFIPPLFGLAADLSGRRTTPPHQELSGMAILVTDEHYKHTLGLVRHLGQRGARVDVLAESPHSLACTTRYCNEVVPVSSPETIAFLAAAREAVARNRYDVVIPVGYPRTLMFAQHRSEFVAHTKIELASAESIELAANKVRMVELAKRVGVPTPKTFVPSALGDVNEAGRLLRYPLVVKPQRESRGRSVRYAHTDEELREGCAPYFPPLTPEADPPIVQEFIPGDGCGFFATYQKGVCKRIFMHRRVREYPASGGVSTCAESFYDARLEVYGRRLLDAMSWHGVAMVEVRRDSRDGEFKLIEVNPKLWGSLDLALAAGADFPGDLCRMAVGQELEFTDRYNRHLRYRWPFSISGELYHLKSRPLSVVDTTLDFLNPRVKSNIWFSDLRPNLVEMGLLVQFLVSPKSRRG